MANSASRTKVHDLCKGFAGHSYFSDSEESQYQNSAAKRARKTIIQGVTKSIDIHQTSTQPLPAMVESVQEICMSMGRWGVEVAPYVSTVRICLSKGAPTIEVLFDLPDFLQETQCDVE